MAAVAAPDCASATGADPAETDMALVRWGVAEASANAGSAARIDPVAIAAAKRDADFFIRVLQSLNIGRAAA